MASLKTFPHLTADPASVTIKSSWKYLMEDREIDIEDLLDSWNTSTDVSAEINLKVNLKRVLMDCGLDSDAQIRLASGWRSTGTMLRGNGTRIDLNSVNSKSVQSLRIRLLGTEAIHDVLLFAAIILISPGSNPKDLSARLPGSILWVYETRLVIDELGHYFPLEIIDFGEKNWQIPVGSAWYLDWDPSDLYQTTFGDVVLYLNTANEMIQNVLSARDSSSSLFERYLVFDVARALILGALNNSAFVEDPGQFPEGTVGSTVYNLISEYFPLETVSTLLDKSNNKSIFDALLQHHLSLFRA